MHKTYYAHGKLLITGEYLVLDKAKALALPTKLGQKLSVKTTDKSGIKWSSFLADGSLWFSQEFNFDIFSTVYDICMFQAGFYGVSKSVAAQRVEFYLKKLELWDKRDSKAKELSGGMKRRLMIARALVHEPKVLVLDEPTAWVDVELRKTMWEFIEMLNKEKNITIILTTHYLEEVEQLCKNVAILTGGEIVYNGWVKSLLKTLDEEIFVLDLKDEMKEIPKRFDQYKPKLTDGNTLELSVKADESVNEIFSVLSEKWIDVLSMRNKSNRLEQLFLQLAHK